MNTNIKDRIPFKTISFGYSSNKRRRPGKPWWNDELTKLWSDVCTANRSWVSCKQFGLKKHLRSDYIRIRKVFDRNVQKYKRLYWYNQQQQILNERVLDKTGVWKTGKIGINNNKSNSMKLY